MRALIGLIVAALVALGLAAGPASAAQKPERGPSKLAFFDPPADLPARHGKLIWQRRAHGEVPLAAAESTRLILYTSKTPGGEIAAVSGSVSVPEGKAPKKGWPVVSYGHGTTGIADICAPTRNNEFSPASDYISYIDPQLDEWLEAGYAVVRSDYQGLGTPGSHPYLIGEAEGRGVLDAVSAARRLDRSIGRRMLLAGHSQGGHAVLFAAGEADQYSPKLKLRGTVAYAPGSHILQQAQSLELLTQPSPLSALAAMIVSGASTASPAVDPEALLSPEALALYPQVEDVCLSQLSRADSFGGIAPADMLAEDADTGPLFEVLEGMNPAVSTRAPILLAQGDADTTALKFFTDLLDEELRELGDDVTYNVYEGVGHGEVVDVAQPDVLDFFEQRLPAGR